MKSHTKTKKIDGNYHDKSNFSAVEPH